MLTIHDAAVLGCPTGLSMQIPVIDSNGERIVLQRVADAAMFMSGIEGKAQRFCPDHWILAEKALAIAVEADTPRNRSRATMAVYNLAEAAGHLSRR
jgi:hypothetical protein